MTEQRPFNGCYCQPEILFLASVGLGALRSATEISKKSCKNGGWMWTRRRSLALVQRSVPEWEKRCRSHLKTPGDSCLPDHSLHSFLSPSVPYGAVPHFKKRHQVRHLARGPALRTCKRKGFPMQSTNIRQIQAALVDQTFFRSARVFCAIGIVVAVRRRKGQFLAMIRGWGDALVSGGQRQDRVRSPHAPLISCLVPCPC